MAVSIKVLIPAKQAENAQTTQYTATNCKAIIDKFTATNTTAGNVTISVNLVTSGGTAGVIQPLIPSGGITGEPYDGRHAVVWRLRLHPNGGLGFLPDPSSGEPALAVVQESGVGSRATRWYSGDGPPPTTLQPPPAVGDFYLDRLSGQVYELSA